MQVVSMQYARNKKKTPRFNFGAKRNTFLVLLPYLRLEFSAYILAQGRSWVELVPLGCLVDFRSGTPFLREKTMFLVHLPYIP